MMLAVALLLLVLLLCASSCRVSYSLSLPESITFELDQHLGVSVQQPGDSSWADVISIHRHLDGTGFHRTLELRLSPEAGASSLEGCLLSLLQPLPSSVFADPYQLEDLTRGAAQNVAGGYDYSFKLFGPLDLELPAPACQDTALLLGLNSTWLQQQQQDEQHGHHVTLRVPLHAKYSQPRAFAYQGWTSWGLTGHSAASLPWPFLLLDCRPQEGDVLLLPPQPTSSAPTQPQHVCSSSSSSGADDGVADSTTCSKPDTPQASSSSSSSPSSTVELLWLVPAGNLDHEVLVSWGTLLLTACCCMAVSWSAIRSGSRL